MKPKQKKFLLSNYLKYWKSIKSRSSIGLLLFVFIPVGLFAQPIECTEDISKKALKLFEKGIDKRGSDKIERMRYLKEAIELQPDFAEAMFFLAIEQIKLAKFEGTSLKPAEENLLQVVNLCPNYHSDTYYYLSQILLGKKEYSQALYYQKKFIEFTSNNDSKFAKDYAKKFEEIKRDIEYTQFYAHAFANPVPFNPIRVENVSTNADEYLPLLTPDNKFLFYTRRSVYHEKVPTTFIKSDKPQYLEQFVKSNHYGKTFDGGEPMPEPFNQNRIENYGGATISLDNKHLFLTICKPTGTGYKNCDIYYAHYVYFDNPETAKRQGYWTSLENMGPNINTPDGWESQPALSGDGKTLYFASWREGSKEIDIYKSEKNANGQWGKAENLGEPINSEFKDKAPFIHSDSQTLYFSSDRPMGFGGFDVYYSKLMENGKFLKPKNIGYPINTESDEHGFVVSTDGRKAYFASDKIGDKFQGLDIYTFELYEDARPEKVAFLKGEVLDKTGEPAKNTTVEIKNLKTQEIQEVKVDEDDGGYAAIVKIDESKDFVVNLKGNNLAFESKLITFNDSTEDGIYNEVALKAEEVNVGHTYNLEDIQYETNSAEIKQVSKIMLQEFAKYLLAQPNIILAIHGHTDNVGDAQKNLILSTDRAYSVVAYLQELGIPKNRLKFKGFGETRPIATNITEEGRAQNRRTEFVVLDK